MFSPIFWRLYSVCYDAICKLYPYQAMTDQIVRLIPVSKHLELLDAGCGTGNFEVALQKARPNANIFAVDYSDAMLKRAVIKHCNNTEFHRLDLSKELKWDNERFDVVVCINVLYTMLSPVQLIDELKRVLRSGGLLIISTPKRQPSILRIVQEHIRNSGLFSLIPVIIPLTLVGLFSLIIVRNGKIGKYHFFDKKEICQLINVSDATSTYAGQNWLVVWQKEKS